MPGCQYFGRPPATTVSVLAHSPRRVVAVPVHITAPRLPVALHSEKSVLDSGPRSAPPRSSVLLKPSAKTKTPIFQKNISSPPIYSRALQQGTEPLIPIPIPIPDLSGDGDGGPIPDLPGMGGPSPSPSPICRGWGVHPHPHPRFESGIQLSTIEYCKGVEFRLPARV